MSQKQNDVYYEGLREELVKLKEREEEILQELLEAGYITVDLVEKE